MAKNKFEPSIDPFNGDKQHEERQIPKENKYMGSRRLHKNHTFYKYSQGVLSVCAPSDFATEEIEIKTENLIFKNPDNIQIGNYKKKKIKINKPPQIEIRKKLIIEPNTIYFSSLNDENALKYCMKHGLIVNIIKK